MSTAETSKRAAKPTDEKKSAAAGEPPEATGAERDDISSMTAEERSKKAEKIIQDHVLLGIAAGLVPGPAIDIALAIGVQLTMLKRLSSLYGVPFRRNVAKGTVMALLSGAGGLGVGAILSFSLIKFIPALGTAIGVAGTSLSIGAFTYAVGKVFEQHFESGGTFIDLDPRAYRDYFQDMFKRGRDVASRRSKEAKAMSEDEIAGMAAEPVSGTG